MNAPVSVAVSSQDRVVIGVAYDCVEKTVYWTDITGPGISKASLSGGDVVPVITKGENGFYRESRLQVLLGRAGLVGSLSVL